MRFFMISDYDSSDHLPSSYFLIRDSDERGEDQIYCDFVRKINTFFKLRDNQYIMDNSTQIWTLRDIDYLSAQ